MKAEAKVNVIVKSYAGKEADTILAQSEGYKRIVWEILSGNADAEPEFFMSTVKSIIQQQSEKGA